VETIVSPDGTQIAFDRHVGGDAGTVILISGALSSRALPKMKQTAEALATHHALTVINYDRRGRGDSGDTPGVYDVEHEIDDLGVLVAAAGGSASLFGWSSGAALALRAAASGRIAGIHRVVAFEPPFVVDREHHVPPAGLTDTLHELVAANRRSETVRFYMTKAMGIPAVFVTLMRVLPIWSKLKATANSTPHDWAVMAEFMRGEPLRSDDWAGVTIPTLVLAGGKSEPVLRKAARAIAEVLPNAEYREVPNLSHNPDVRLLEPAAAEFLTRSDTGTP
jgi:pimeloyl-ACP methyl ester carboxylesterase